MSSEDGPILDELVSCFARGEPPDLDDLLQRFVGREAEVRRLYHAASRYSQLASDLPVARTRPLDLLPGDRLGSYEIVRLIARGGMGEVYAARQTSLGSRIVALKVLPKEIRSHATTARFRREARVLSDLHHPNLAEVYEFGECDGRLYYAMRYVVGPTLREILQRRPANHRSLVDREKQRTAVSWVIDVAHALWVLHERRLVHRDVKPSNVILENSSDSSIANRRAVLVDFGLVRHIDSRTITGTGLGAATPSYAPPEQVLGYEVTLRADVFALGVTLHDLLTGLLPGERIQASAGLTPVENIVPSVDSDLSAIVSKASDPDSAWRYADAREMVADLRAWYDGSSVSARGRGLRERWKRHPLERRRLIVASVFSIVLCAALLVGHHLPTSSEPIRTLPLIQRVRSPVMYPDGFGHDAVAVSGDTLVIGAPNYMRGEGVHVGAVYLSALTLGNWGPLEPPLSPASLQPGDRFGRAVAVHGDVFVVGAPRDGEGGENAGVAYVFRRLQGTWQREPWAVLRAPNPVQGAMFGLSVATNGAQIAIGAPNLYTSGEEGGAVCVFRRVGANWGKPMILPAHTERGCFGFQVAMEDDVLVVGEKNASRVFVYRKTKNDWVEEGVLTDHKNGATFGASLSVHGNLIAVGAPNDDTQGTSAGAVHVYRRDSTTGAWRLEPGMPLYSLEPSLGDVFGKVAISNSFLIVGAQGSKRGEVNGQAFLFRYNGDGWIPDAEPRPDDLVSGGFGHTVALNGTSVFISSVADEAAQGSGTVYVYDASPE